MHMALFRGQASVEFSLTLAIQLLIVALLMVVFASVFNQIALRSDYIVAQDAVGQVSDAAKEAYSSGYGSKLVVNVKIPESALMNSSYISNYTVDLYLASFGDVTAPLPFQVSGKWPNQTGSAIIEIENNGTDILVRPMLAVQLNSSNIYVAINKSVITYSLTTVQLRNRMPVNYNYTPTVACSPSISCILNPGNSVNLGTYDPNDKQSIIVNVSAQGAPVGIYTGHINFTTYPATVNPALPNATFILPITARVVQ